MPKSELSALPLTIDKLFSDKYEFKTPTYQRPYAWTQEQAGELLSDFRNHMSDESTPLTSIDPYFLGTIVLVKDTNSQMSVVDGLQRLATLTILLAVLRKLLPKADASELSKFIYRRSPFSRRWVGRLSLRGNDEVFFKDYVQADGGLDRLRNVDTNELSESQQRIVEVARYFLAQLADFPRTAQRRLARFALTNCQLVVVSTPDADSAFNIFTVLNRRGIQLTVVDFVKAEILGGIEHSKLVTSEQVEDYAAEWESLEESLGRDGFQDLIGYTRTIYRPNHPQQSVLQDFRADVIGSRSGVELVPVLENILSPLGQAMTTILKHNYYSVGDTTVSEHVREINRLCRWLTLLENTDWMPPAIAYLRQHQVEPLRLTPFFARLERLAAYLLVMRVEPSGRMERYRKVLAHLADGQDLISHDSPLELSDAEAAAMLGRLDGNIYSYPGPSRLYLLLRLDDALANGRVSYDVQKYTVEHILPQNAKGSWLNDWNRCWADPKIRAKWVNRLANLVLLDPTTNQLAGNEPFSRKREIYSSSPTGAAPFVLTNDAMKERRWSTEVVAVRQGRLLRVFANLWRLPSPDILEPAVTTSAAHPSPSASQVDAE